MPVITITTSEQNVNNLGDTVQLIIAITDNSIGSDQEWDAKDYGILVVSWGTLETSYTIEEALMTYSQYEFTLGDCDSRIYNLLFGGNDIDIEGYVQLKINGVVAFDGYIVEDGLEYNLVNKNLKISVMPKMDLLNNALVVDENGSMLNPYSFPTYGVQDITLYLDLIYQMVDSSLSYSSGNIIITHDWLFKGIKTTSPYNTKDDIRFDECKFFWNPYSDQYGVSCVADVLKTMAINFCAFTGMTGQGKAFFKKLFYYDADNLQTLNKVLSHIISFRVQLLDYVGITLKLYTVDPPPQILHEQGDKYKANIQNKSMTKTIYLGFFSEDPPYAPGDTQQMLATTARGDSDDGTYQLQYVADPNINSGTYYSDINDLIARFWYYYRHNINQLRIDKFLVYGIDYDYLKDFNYNGVKYQPINMKKNLADSTTEIEAIYIGEL